MLSSADDVDGKRVRARHIGFLGAAEPVFCRIPRDDNAVPRARVFFQKLDEEPELIAAEMFAPTIPIGHGDNTPRIREAVPDLGVIAQEMRGLVCSTPSARIRFKSPWYISSNRVMGAL